MGNPEASDYPGIECPCCRGFNNGEFCDCDCGVAPSFSRFLLKHIAAGEGLESICLVDQPALLKDWRQSRDANFFIECEKRRERRTIASVGPIAMQKYAARFWPYLNSAVRQRCLLEKKLPCYQLGRFIPVPGGNLVEQKRIQVEKLLRQERRELGPGDPNIVVFSRIFGYRKASSGKLFDAVVETLKAGGGTDEEIAEALRCAQVEAQLRATLPGFLFVNGCCAYLLDDGPLKILHFSDRWRMEEAVVTVAAAPEAERKARLLEILRSPPHGLSIDVRGPGEPSPTRPTTPASPVST